MQENKIPRAPLGAWPMAGADFSFWNQKKDEERDALGCKMRKQIESGSRVA